MPSYSIIQSDVLVALKAMPDASFDALLTDPPSGIGFMGHEWDSDKGGRDAWIKWLAEIAVEIARVLRPGAYGLVWSLPRTSHWTATALEDGGLELRDRVAHIFGSGFPKPATTADKMIDAHLENERPVIGSRTLTGNAAISSTEKGGTLGVQVGSIPAKKIDVTGPACPDSARWDGYGMALKPSVEDWWLVRKPLDGTIAHNCLEHGVGALNIPGARIGLTGGMTKAGQTPDSESRGTYGRGLNGSYGVSIDAGRWPSHLTLDEDAAAALDEQAGDRPSTLAGHGDPTTSHAHPSDANSPRNVYGMDLKTAGTSVYADDGGPSRYFYVAKPSTAEREFGCEALPLRSVSEMTGGRAEGSAGLDSPQSGAGRGGGARNFHPTIKGVSLTKWLATLLLPPPRADSRPRRILCPFSGSGGEMIGAMRAGWDEIVGIEKDPDFVTIAQARLARWSQVPAEMSERDAVGESRAESKKTADGQVSLFGGAT